MAKAGLSRQVRICEPLDPFDLVGMRKTPGAFVATIHETMGRPEWLLKGTSCAISGNIPERITVRDYLTMIGNLQTMSEDSAYFLDYALAGVPLYYGALDLGIRYAPSIESALQLILKYADDRPGYHQHRLTREDTHTVLELVPATDLGAGRSSLVEIPLLFFYQAASRLLGRPAREVIVYLAHSRPSHAERLMAILQCRVCFDAGRDAIAFPDSITNLTGITYDHEIWRIAEVRCQEEKKTRIDHDMIFMVRKEVLKKMSDNGRVPRLQDTAEALHMSGRTLIRHLRRAESTYQEIVDEILQHRSKALLADSMLSISQVAEELNFPDDSGFHRKFRRWFGMTPAQYRRELQAA